jgi:F5/8 type C domain
VEGFAVSLVPTPFVNVKKPTPYRYFRLNITTDEAGAYPNVGELKIYVGATKYPTSTMTSNTAPSPLVASASSEYSGQQAYKAFDDNTGTNWGGNANPPGWLEIDLGSGNEIAPSSYHIVASSLGTRSPKDFTFEGSNDGTNWDVLSSPTAQTSWSAYEERTFTI